MRRAVLVALLLALMASAVPAHAKQTLAPPGASAIDEYLETVPSSGGNKITGGGGSPGHALTAGQRRALAAQGPDGVRAAAVADATGPSRPPAHRRGRTPGTSDTGPGARHFSPDTSRPGVPDALARALGGSGGGIGAALPALLIISLLAAVALAVRRRRSA